jgi:hypothetical protein
MPMTSSDYIGVVIQEIKSCLKGTNETDEVKFYSNKTLKQWLSTLQAALASQDSRCGERVDGKDDCGNCSHKFSCKWSPFGRPLCACEHWECCYSNKCKPTPPSAGKGDG